MKDSVLYSEGKNIILTISVYDY